MYEWFIFLKNGKNNKFSEFLGVCGLLRHPYGPTTNQNNAETSSVWVETRSKRHRSYRTTFGTRETSYGTAGGVSTGFHTHFAEFPVPGRHLDGSFLQLRCKVYCWSCSLSALHICNLRASRHHLLSYPQNGDNRLHQRTPVGRPHLYVVLKLESGQGWLKDEGKILRYLDFEWHT
jgi:hypothetical protein